MDLDQLNQYLKKAAEERNRRRISEFEGYSPKEMQSILYDTFGKDSPIRLKKMKSADYERIPLLNQIKYMMHLVEKAGELKLTKRGNLPVKVVADIYEQGYIEDYFIEKGISKLYKEEDTQSINLPKILLEISGLVKKRNNKWSLTKKGSELLTDDRALLRRMWHYFGSRFNWAYYDGYETEKLGRLGYGFSLILLDKYGDKSRKDSFYAEKYLKAFPDLLGEVRQTTYRDRKHVFTNCYSTRTFDRFLDYFGLIHIQKGSWQDPTMISKTPLFSKMIQIIPPVKND